MGCHFLGDLPDPGIEPRSLALGADALTSEPPGEHRTGREKAMMAGRLLSPGSSIKGSTLNLSPGGGEEKALPR